MSESGVGVVAGFALGAAVGVGGRGLVAPVATPRPLVLVLVLDGVEAADASSAGEDEEGDGEADGIEEENADVSFAVTLPIVEGVGEAVVDEAVLDPRNQTTTPIPTRTTIAATSAISPRRRGAGAAVMTFEVTVAGRADSDSVARLGNEGTFAARSAALDGKSELSGGGGIVDGM